ncbi:hypothetical protein VA603_06470 [Stenotrophomonas sp. MH1]|uniref:Lipoprotein n=1 Tax=Stenotrophomonas capsici TaxID=3110230 RepID=A0ABU5V1E9_9GAMM|nr:hypothetical protein [Stenotrophomonas sp. MH1]MEA5667180.1 hypothetical protein [Stenotrophomonas sp. MH1]
MLRFARSSVFALMALGMVGCGNSPVPADGAASPAEPAVEATDVSAAVASDFPRGFVPEFSYRIRSKANDTVEGVEYKRLVVEFKGADVASIDKAVEAGLVKIGYRRYKTLNQENGAIVGDYGKDGHRITATTTPKSESMSLFDPEAKGTVYFVWRP